MLSSRLVPLSLAALALITGCKRSTDAKLIGRWQTPAMDAAIHIVFKPDHTFELQDGDGGVWTVVATGTWHVEDHQLVTETKTSLGKPIARSGKNSIARLTADELLLKEADGNTYTYKRSR